MQIKYSLTNNNTTIEFCTSEQAQAYKSANNLNTDIIVIEYEDLPGNPIPNVTPRQIRQALVLGGVSMSQITDALASLSEPTKTLAIIEWEYSNTFERDRPLVLAVGQMLGWTPVQLDDLWKLAATL